MVSTDISTVETVQAMFGMGTWETMIILVVALIFLGPEKLPAVAKSIGKGMRTLRRAMSSVEYEVQAMTNPDRYAPPKKPQAQAGAPGTEPDEDEHHPIPEHGIYDADGSDDGHADAAHGDLEGNADPDHFAPPADYDHHQEPGAQTVDNSASSGEDNSADPATTTSGAPETVAAAHPYRRTANPAPGPAPERPSAPPRPTASLASDAPANAEAPSQQDDTSKAEEAQNA